jgi:hypothetical protein
VCIPERKINEREREREREKERERERERERWGRERDQKFLFVKNFLYDTMKSS